MTFLLLLALIRQWIVISAKSNSSEGFLPLTVTKQLYECITHIGTAPSIHAVPDYNTFATTNNAFKFYAENRTTGAAFLLLNISV